MFFLRFLINSICEGDIFHMLCLLVPRTRFIFRYAPATFCLGWFYKFLLLVYGRVFGAFSQVVPETTSTFTTVY